MQARLLLFNESGRSQGSRLKSFCDSLIARARSQVNTVGGGSRPSPRFTLAIACEGSKAYRTLSAHRAGSAPSALFISAFRPSKTGTNSRATTRSAALAPSLCFLRISLSFASMTALISLIFSLKTLRGTKSHYCSWAATELRFPSNTHPLFAYGHMR